MGPGPALDGFVQEAPKSHVVIGPDGEVERGRYDRVAVTVRDRGELRALRVPKGVRTAALAVWLDEGRSALSLTPRPEWPALTTIRSRAVDGGWLTVLRFDAAVPVHRVVAELGRQAVWPDHAGQRGVVLPDEATDKVPADPVEVTDPDPVLELGPLDERVLNPIGFERDVDGPVVDLSEQDWGRGPTEALVRGLRRHLGVRVDLPEETPLRTARVVAGLAMAGVPLTAERVAGRVAAHLGPDVTAAITARVDLADPQAREEHSLVLRRAALTAYSSFAWRARLAAIAGVRGAAQPSVSVVLATRRPDLLEHAVGQVTRQRGVARLELVLAPHGFEVDAARLAELGNDSTVEQVPMPEDAVFGDVLNVAAEAASGDVVLKMDDDDWYAPDAVADLLLARDYSGAELVGMPDDVYYLEPTDETVRIGQPSEVYRQFVAGGTLMLDRGLLHEVGGFRSVRRHVDAQLIAAVRAAGGATYRTHGLGYVLRRTDTGHTWQADLDELRSRAAETRPRFSPGRLMELGTG
ncbi:glycosyltransferase [Nocardioides halotolerans]|uniref:glycosyltransferase n=1 Tax=Nocardioides halotolerans TaxID=433660 RepID=UPI00040CC70E|nr:glycosyltransferase [Nocardioides halotolerans]